MTLDFEKVEIGKSEVYWKNIDRYELTFGDRKLVLHKEEDSNGGDTHYMEGKDLFKEEELEPIEHALWNEELEDFQYDRILKTLNGGLWGTSHEFTNYISQYSPYWVYCVPNKKSMEMVI